MTNKKTVSSRSRCSVSIWVLIGTNILVFQLSTTWLTLTSRATSSSSVRSGPSADFYQATSPVAKRLEATSESWNPLNPLAIPPGQAKNLPSVRVQEDDSKTRGFYGGKGDKKHLGGFTEIDTWGISPTVWTKMITDYGVHSFLDVGCGRGISTRWFLEHGADVLCVEGSHDAVTKSFLPPERIVEHDFSRGPWWPGKTYDAAWSVEFLEHVSRQYHFNYIQAFRKAALIFVTSSRWGGWHHVEIHPDDWWIRKFESYGFRYDEKLTNQTKTWAMTEKDNRTIGMRAPNGKPFRAVHVIQTLKVFVNPVVAALPQHAHLFPRDGCYKDDAKFNRVVRTKPCGVGKNAEKETALPDSFQPLKVTPEMHQRWDAAIRKGLNQVAKH